MVKLPKFIRTLSPGTYFVILLISLRSAKLPLIMYSTVVYINSFLTDPDINLHRLNVFNLLPFYSYMMLWVTLYALWAALCVRTVWAVGYGLWVVRIVRLGLSLWAAV